MNTNTGKRGAFPFCRLLHVLIAACFTRQPNLYLLGELSLFHLLSLHIFLSIYRLWWPTTILHFTRCALAAISFYLIRVDGRKLKKA